MTKITTVLGMSDKSVDSKHGCGDKGPLSGRGLLLRKPNDQRLPIVFGNRTNSTCAPRWPAVEQQDKPPV